MKNIFKYIIHVNLPLLRITVAAGLFAATSLQASADPASAAPATAPAPPSALLDAVVAMARDIGQHQDAHAPMRAQLDALTTFRHTPETAQKLLKVFGSEQPWTFTRVPAAQGRHGYLGMLAPLHYVSEQGMAVDWSAMRIDIALDGAGRNMVVRGDWGSIAAEDKNMRFSQRDLRMTSRRTRGAGDLWFGDTELDIGSVKVEAKAPGVSMALDDIRIKVGMAARPKTVEIGYGVTIKAISAGGERVDNFKLVTRITNIDKAAMVRFKALVDKREGAEKETPQQRIDAMTPALKAMGKAAIAYGTALEIDELSAQYHGNSVSLKGRVSLQGATEADLDSVTTLVKKIVAHFDIKVPVAVLRDVSSAVATRQASAQANGQASAQPVASIAQTMTDIMVGKALNNGYARLEKDVLLSSIDLRGGILRINGKELALPSLTAPAVASAPAAVSIARASPAFLRARRIDDRCALPDYPPDVVRLDQPLRLSMRFTVGADGIVRDLALAAPSQWPAYDQAVLAAAAHCIYLPALRDGLPAAVPMTWQVVREPGSTRP
ncbi:MAG: DUF945 family protein [Pseudomonadota bacterium]|nr:DUF945 family protein [Pseudomonadota bacterium]